MFRPVDIQEVKKSTGRCRIRALGFAQKLAKPFLADGVWVRNGEQTRWKGRNITQRTSKIKPLPRTSYAELVKDTERVCPSRRKNVSRGLSSSQCSHGSPDLCRDVMTTCPNGQTGPEFVRRVCMSGNRCCRPQNEPPPERTSNCATSLGQHSAQLSRQEITATVMCKLFTPLYIFKARDVLVIRWFPSFVKP